MRPKLLSLVNAPDRSRKAVIAVREHLASPSIASDQHAHKIGDGGVRYSGCTRGGQWRCIMKIRDPILEHTHQGGSEGTRFA